MDKAKRLKEIKEEYKRSPALEQIYAPRVIDWLIEQLEIETSLSDELFLALRAYMVNDRIIDSACWGKASKAMDTYEKQRR